MASTLTPSTTTTDPLNVAESAALSTHKAATNPHSVTAAQVGAEPVNANIQSHISNTANPHATPVAFTPVKGVAAMRLLTPINNAKYWLEYHTTEGDGGHGSFRGVTGAAPATYVDNGGTIIVPTGGDGSAAFLREFADQSELCSKDFGAQCDGVTDETTINQLYLDSFPNGGIFNFPHNTTCGKLTFTQSVQFVLNLYGTWNIPINVDTSKETFYVPSYVSVYGYGSGIAQTQFSQNPRTAYIKGPDTSPALVTMAGSSGNAMENVKIEAPTNIGLLIDGTGSMAAVTKLRNVSCLGRNTSVTSRPFVCKTSFWIDMEDCSFLQFDGGGPYSMEFRADAPDLGAYSGLINCKNVRVNYKGILIHNDDVSQNTVLFTFEDAQIENLVSGGSMFTFDIQNNTLQNFKVIRPQLFDNAGTGYLFKNIGVTIPSGIEVEGYDYNYTLFDPATVTTPQILISGARGNHYNYDTGVIVPPYGHYTRIDPTFIDARNVNVMPGLTTLPVTAEVLSQDITTWAKSGGATVTGGVIAPDGSSNAYAIGGAINGEVGQSSPGHTPALGDWYIVGYWSKAITPNQVHGISYLMLVGGNWFVNGTTSSLAFFAPNVYTATDVGGQPWVWMCSSVKITTAGSGSTWPTIKFRNETNRSSVNVFAPGIIRITASLGFTDGEISRISRSITSWPSGAKVGTTTTLDHQTFRTGLDITANRPSASAVGAGAQFFDTTLNKPIWSDGNIWKDATGAAV